jgi:hypothetical protein
VSESDNETAAGERRAAALDYGGRFHFCALPLHNPVDGVCSCHQGADCKTPGKHPRLDNWPEAASSSIWTIADWWKQWPHANIGILTGARSGIVVLDVDPRSGGDDALAALIAEHGPLPETPTVLTGGGGTHYYFAHPGEPLRGRELAPGLELKADGQFVVAPPSLTGGEPVRPPHLWELDTSPGDVPLAHPPDWLLERSRRQSTNARAEPLPPVIRDGAWHMTMVSAAGRMRYGGFTEQAAVAALLEQNQTYDGSVRDDGTEIRELVADVYGRYDAEQAIELRRRPDGEPCALDQVVEAFRNWLHLPDPGALYVTLAAVVANRLPGDPLWLLLVAASSSGKTEILFSLSALDEVVAAATLTEAALLSGTPKRDRSSGASGGLLSSIGEYGILTLKDFGSILSLRHETRAGVLAALREVYDGSWDRPVGVDGGRVLHWHGKLGLIAGVTTVVDSHHAVIDSLGSRFAFYRVEVDERETQGMRALEHRADVAGMRAELREAVAGLFNGLELPDADTLDDGDKQRIVTLANLVTMARSPIERDRVSREIELIPDPEAPARFALVLAGLLEGLRVLGLDEQEAWRLVDKTAFDSMPALRRRILEQLAGSKKLSTREIAVALGLPTTTARRTLEDLAAHGLLERESGGEGKADHWQLTAWARERYDRSRKLS